MLYKYYSIQSREKLEAYVKRYLEMVRVVLNNFSVDLENNNIEGDHLGVQVISAREFNECSKLLSTYSRLIHDKVIHDRRNRVYEFDRHISTNYLKIPRIEIFEPKPGADIKNLKPGIEHVAFYVKNYFDFVKELKKNDVPIDKEAEYSKGSWFIKTSFLDLVEVEFRNDYLGVK